MRALRGTRLLAALCALMLMFASIARAGAPGRPVDRPEGPPEPQPLQIGDPDEPHGLILIFHTPWGCSQIHVRGMSFPGPTRVASRAPQTVQRVGTLRSLRVGHAR